ncbi:MAG: hypothetical protein KF819_19045 [Labilithrix sp.]|nr:hypothetical protein [Labilithrix sp.]
MASRMSPFEPSPSWSSPSPGETPTPAPPPGETPPPPTGPWTPSPWVQGPARAYVALPAVMVGVLASAAVWLGLAVMSVSIVFWRSMSLFTQLMLMVVAGYFLAAGLAYVITARHKLQIA